MTTQNLNTPLDSTTHAEDAEARRIDFTVLPASTEALESISAQVRDIQHSLTELTQKFMQSAVYKAVGLGLYLLKAEMQFLLKAQPDTLSGKSRKRNEKGQLKAQEGFTAWLEKEHPDINERQSLRYRNAARNAGLTSDHTLQDVENLRQAAALHEKTLSELYKTPSQIGAGETPEPEPSTVNLVKHVQRDLFSFLDQTLQVREQMEAEDYETTTQRIWRTLESFTGAKWEMVEARDDSAEHGDIADARGDAKTRSVKAEAAAKKKGGRK